jgi:hypothetical protein
VTGDLVERLTRALDEREAVVRAAWTEPGAGEWRVTTHGGLAQGPYMMLEPHHVDGQLGSRALAHIAASDPAHVLRTIQAHRAIVDEAVSWWHEEHEDGWYSCGLMESCINDLARGSCTCGLDARRDVILGALASIYFPEGTE